MKCNNCPALMTEGYEYPESYCGIGVPEDEWQDFKDNTTGCLKRMKSIEKELKRIEVEASEYYGRMGEEMAAMMIYTDEKRKVFIDQMNNVLQIALLAEKTDINEKSGVMVKSFLTVLDEGYQVIKTIGVFSGEDVNIAGGLSQCFTGDRHPSSEEADYINNIKDLFQYWCESNIDTDAEKIKGLYFSIMGTLDGHNITVKPADDPECGNIAGNLQVSLGLYKGERI